MRHAPPQKPWRIGAAARAAGVHRGGGVAYHGGTYRGGAVACRAGVYRNGHWRPGVAAGVGAAAIAAAAAGFYYNNYNDTYNTGQCGHYPYPPCY